jgi:prolyl 4-hydroxylase
MARSTIKMTLLMLIPCILLTSKATLAMEYGVDISFPMHYPNVSTNYPWLTHNVDSSLVVPTEYEGMPIQPLGNRQEFYNNMIQGCIDYYGDKADRCLVHEKDRIEMNLRQPQSMKNFTEFGVRKIPAPPHVWKLLQDFWDKNHGKEVPENWPAGNTYTNHWSSPTYMLSVEDVRLHGGGHEFRQAIWNAARTTIEEWTKQELRECSLYGIRIYTEGSVLNTHVDRLPLVSSAIINVAQDLDEPWPLEVIAHDGKAHNITLFPGEMALYESHSILHGRPFPLKGRYMANVFVHFEAVGPLGGNEDEVTNDESDLPPYLIPNSPEENFWRQEHPEGYQRHGEYKETFQTGSTVAHAAAQTGNLHALSKILEKKPTLVSAQDENGWTPLHEGARGGHMEIVQLLYEKGAKINLRSDGGRGGTSLFYAKERHGENHPVVKFLVYVGGLELGPEL